MSSFVGWPVVSGSSKHAQLAKNAKVAKMAYGISG